jgi:MYXO-CTERM domain-containing protein
MKRPVQLFTLFLFAGSAASAYAEDCITDEDCPTGFACEEFAETCPDSPPCLPEEDCSEPEPCGESAYTICVPAPTPCSSDDDCTDDWECLTFMYEECSGGGSTEPTPIPEEPGDGHDSGGDDEPGADPEDDEPEPDHDWECEAVGESYCAPPYVGECDSDSDCGEGFTCIEIEACACGGSSSSSGGSTDPVPSPEDPDRGDGPGEPDGDEGEHDEGEGEPEPEWEDDCECSGSGSFYCEPVEIDCDADSDCPEDWSCEDWGVSVSTACYEDEDGEVICEDAPLAESYSRCEPPGWGAWGGAGGDFDRALATAEGAEESVSDSLPFAPAPGDESGGCTSARGVDGGAGLLALFGLLGFRRRR